MTALNSIRKTFDRNIESAELLFDVARTFSYDPQSDKSLAPIKPGQANRIAGLAFLVLVKGWEELVEACLIRYLIGAPAPNGNIFPLSQGVERPLKLSEAYGHKNLKMLLIGGAHLKVTDWNRVMNTANKTFVDGQPFTSLTKEQIELLSHATAIRNRIAHDSRGCRDRFLAVADFHGDKKGMRPHGYSVGHLLLKESDTGFGKNASKQAIFLHYLQRFQEMANIICPVPNISGRNK